MLEIKSKHDTSMYDKVAKLKLSSTYGMMVTEQLANLLYKSNKSQIYVDSDSVRKEGKDELCRND